jgi:hypothetical protein
MMEGIFDIDGRTVAWLHDDLVRDLDGYAVAFIRGSAIYNYNGVQLGFFVNGYFQDEEGNTVAAIRGAHGKPLVPEIKPSPIQPDLHEPPLDPVPDVPATPPISTTFWSDLEWDDFVD